MQLDNANPIVFQPTQESYRLGNEQRFTLWDNESSDHVSDDSIEDEFDVEPVDEQEVFGKKRTRLQSSSNLTDYYICFRPYSINI